MKYHLKQVLHDKEIDQNAVINKVYDNNTYQLDVVGKCGDIHVMEKPVSEDYINCHYQPVRGGL